MNMLPVISRVAVRLIVPLQAKRIMSSALSLFAWVTAARR